MALGDCNDFMTRWLELQPTSWRSDAESSMGSSPLIRARQTQAGSGIAGWLVSAESKIPIRGWDDESEDGSICSMPETKQQCRKLKERCLLAEIKLLRSSMGAMKSGIQMEAAGRVGADTRIPYPRADYGQGKLVAEPCAIGPESLPSTGKQKISSDWEELDLRSNSPSATSVQECARLKLFSNGNRGGRELMAKEDAGVHQSQAAKSPLVNGLRSHSTAPLAPHTPSPQKHSISAKFNALWGEQHAQDELEQAHHDSPVSAKVSGPSLEGGLVDEQERGYELFSASLSKAMKAYVLYSDPQQPKKGLEEENRASCPPEVQDTQVTGNSGPVAAEKITPIDVASAGKVEPVPGAVTLPDSQAGEAALKAEAIASPHPRYEAAGGGVPIAPVRLPPLRHNPPPAPKSTKQGFGKKLGKLWRNLAADFKDNPSCSEVSAGGSGMASSVEAGRAAKQSPECTKVQRLGSIFRLGSSKSVPKPGPAPWPLPPAPQTALQPVRRPPPAAQPPQPRSECRVARCESAAPTPEARRQPQEESSENDSMKINAEQWLSNEKAQMSLLLPTWVPSKISIASGSAEAVLPHRGQLAANPAPPASSEIIEKEDKACIQDEEKRSAKVQAVESKRPSDCVDQIPAARDGQPAGDKLDAGNPEEAPASHSNLTPFGRVLCRPERAVPFISVPASPMEDSTDKSAIDTPVTRLENQMRHDAGVEGTCEKDSQWRTIASRVVHGHQFDQMGLRNQAASVPAAGKASKSSGKDKLPSICHQALFEEDRAISKARSTVRQFQQEAAAPSLTASPKRSSRVWPPQQAPKLDAASPEGQGLSEDEASGRRKAVPEQRQVPRWTTKSEEEMASFPGVLALSRKFEHGQLSEGNIAKMSRVSVPGRSSREETARWAREQAAKLDAFPML